MNYSIQRPPLADSFYLPSKENLLNLKIGDTVKIIFRSKDNQSERMWIKIVEMQDISEWTGKLDNDPYDEDLARSLKSGDLVKFHPLDIIQIWSGENNQNS